MERIDRSALRRGADDPDDLLLQQADFMNRGKAPAAKVTRVTKSEHTHESSQSPHVVTLGPPEESADGQGSEEQVNPPDDEASILGGVIEREYEDEELSPQPMDIDFPSQPFPVAVHRKQSKFAFARKRDKAHGHDDSGQAVQSSSDGLPPTVLAAPDAWRDVESSGTSHPTSEKGSIDAENRRHLQSMTPGEVQEAQREILERIPTKTLEFLRARGRSRPPGVSVPLTERDTQQGAAVQLGSHCRALAQEAVHAGVPPDLVGSDAISPAADIGAPGSAPQVLHTNRVPQAVLHGPAGEGMGNRSQGGASSRGLETGETAAVLRGSNTDEGNGPSRADARIDGDGAPGAVFNKAGDGGSRGVGGKEGDGGSLGREVEAARRVRFELDGRPCAWREAGREADPARGVEAVVLRDPLRQDEEGESGRGYTLEEATALSRSSLPAQRVAGCRLLGAVLHQSRPSLGFSLCDGAPLPRPLPPPLAHVDWGHVWAAAIGPCDVPLVLRLALDDAQPQVVVAAAAALQAMLGPSPHEEALLSLSDFCPLPECQSIPLQYMERPHHMGVWVAFPLHPEGGEEGREEGGPPTTPSQVAAEDPLSGLLQMVVLKRVQYLLWKARVAAAVQPLLSILVLVARGGPQPCACLASCAGMVEGLVEAAEGGQAGDQGGGARGLGRAAPLAMRVLRLMCHFDPGFAQRLLDGSPASPSSGARGLVLRGIICTADKEQPSPEACSLTVESLLMWRAFARHGIPLLSLDDMFSSVCRRMCPPPWDTASLHLLHVHNALYCLARDLLPLTPQEGGRGCMGCAQAFLEEALSALASQDMRAVQRRLAEGDPVAPPLLSSMASLLSFLASATPLVAALEIAAPRDFLARLEAVLREGGLLPGPDNKMTGLAASLLHLTLKALPNSARIGAGRDAFGVPLLADATQAVVGCEGGCAGSAASVAPLMDGPPQGTICSEGAALQLAAGECLTAFYQLHTALYAAVQVGAGPGLASPLPHILKVLSPQVAQSGASLHPLSQFPLQVCLLMQVYMPALLLLVRGLEGLGGGAEPLPVPTQRGALEAGLAAMVLLPPGTEVLGLRLLSALWAVGPLLVLLRETAVQRVQEMADGSPQWAGLAFWALQAQGAHGDVEMGRDAPSFIPPVDAMSHLLLQSSTATWLGFLPVGSSEAGVQGVGAASYTPRPAASRLPCPQDWLIADIAQVEMQAPAPAGSLPAIAEEDTEQHLQGSGRPDSVAASLLAFLGMEALPSLLLSNLRPGEKAGVVMERLFEDAEGWHCTATRLAVCGLLHMYSTAGRLQLSPSVPHIKSWVEAFTTSSYGDPLLGTCLMLLMAPTNSPNVQEAVLWGLLEEHSLHLLPSASSCPLPLSFFTGAPVPAALLKKYADLALTGMLDKGIGTSSIFPLVVAAQLRKCIFSGLEAGERSARSLLSSCLRCCSIGFLRLLLPLQDWQERGPHGYEYDLVVSACQGNPKLLDRVAEVLNPDRAPPGT
eukprot:jgi/Botrbrau1/11585/Bobra.247_1s0006.1